MPIPGSAPLAATGEPLYPTTNKAQAPQAGAATIESGPGRLFAVTVTTTGANPLVITDGSGGTAIFGFAASPALGTFPVGVSGNAFNTSLVVAGSATNPAIVLHYSLRGTP